MSRRSFGDVALALFIAWSIGSAVALISVACTPAQRAIVKSVWDVASPIVDCLLSSKYEDEDTAILECGVGEADKPAARRILERKASLKAEAKRDAIAKMGCPKDIRK